MKKIIAGLVLATMLALSPVKVLAAGGVSVSTAALTIEVGEAGTFTIIATNAIGDVVITSSDTSVARVSANEWGTGMVEEGQAKTGMITVTGVSEGTAVITLVLDAATFDGEDLAGQTRTVVANVTRKVEAPIETGNSGSTYEGAVDNSTGASNASGVVSDGSGGEQDGSGDVDIDDGDDENGVEGKSVEKGSSTARQGGSQNNKNRGSDKEKESSKSSGGVWWMVAVAAGLAVLGVGVWAFVKKRGGARRF